ncbi:MAG: hypothetical protein SWE60_08780 [Thermodesulfobacteriota bacterium]|nr:hypothetical protein [Thermodesulfobacteriota bacterium]
MPWKLAVPPSCSTNLVIDDPLNPLCHREKASIDLSDFKRRQRVGTFIVGFLGYPGQGERSALADQKARETAS